MTEASIPYGRQSIDQQDVAAVIEVLRGDWLTTGPTVEAFEASLSVRSGGHPVVAMNSGTAALHGAYASAGLEHGTTLVTTPLTFVATAAVAVHLGADVVFADVDDETLCLDPHAVEAIAPPGTRVITGVDYAGQLCDWPALREIAENIDAVLVDDAAHALGSLLHGRPAGDWADLTTFSFHPVKTITTAEGGAVVVRNHAFLEGVRRFRNHGIVRDPEDQVRPDEGPWHQEVHRFGLNYRMPDLNAALGLSQVRRLDAFIDRRRGLVDRYREHLGEVAGLRLPAVRPGSEVAWHLFVVRVLDGRRREVFERLRSRGIGVQVHYLPVHLHPAFSKRGYRSGMCPIAEAAYGEVLSLPLYPGLTDGQQDLVIAEMRAALGS